jgi:DNA-binding NarL/FixJ family response regulator
MVVSFGHHVRAVAASVSEAIDNAALHAPNVTIMDIRLAGGTSGIDAARENTPCAHFSERKLGW